MLCQTCNQLDVRSLVASAATIAVANNAHWPVTPPSYKWYFGQGAVLQSSRNGCDLCTLVWRNWTLGYRPKYLESFELDMNQNPGRGGQFWIVPKCNYNGILLVSNVSPEKTSSANFQGSAKEAQAAYANRLRAAMMVGVDGPPKPEAPIALRDLELQLFCKRDQAPRGYEHFFLHEVPEDPNPAAIDVAAEKLHKCRREHKLCNFKKGKDDLRLPTRVIDVGTLDCPVERLTISNGMQGEWVALSYCWGGANKLMLTLENLNDLTRGLPLGQLPQTLQDAILVARRLRIRYIWIDAICIIQNSREDWEFEASRMKHVYKNAVLTLSAMSAEKASGGMLGKRQLGYHAHPCFLGWRTNDATRFQTISVAATSDGDTQVKNFDSQYRASPLMKRGWCFQESLLSTRLLCFDQSTLIWECAATREDESGNVELFDRLQSSMALSRGTAFLDRGIREPNWTDIVISYTSKSLTVQTDILVALGGIAAEMAPLNGGKYHAGIWEHNLLEQLLWQRHYTNDHELRARLGRIEETDLQYAREHNPDAAKVPSIFPKPAEGDYLAPSWSWASIYGEPVKFQPASLPPYLQFEDGKEQKQLKKKIDVVEAKILSINTKTAGKDPFGTVISGHLTLKGRFLRVPSPEQMHHSDPGNKLFSHFRTTQYPGPDIFQRNLKTPAEREFEQQHKPHRNQVFALLELVRWNIKYSTGLFNKKPRLNWGDRSSHQIKDSGMYLLVLESANEACSEFRRIGLVKVDYSDPAEREVDMDELKPVWEQIVREIGRWRLW